MDPRSHEIYTTVSFKWLVFNIYILNEYPIHQDGSMLPYLLGIPEVIYFH